MSLVVPNEGEVFLLTRMLKQPNPLTDPFRLRLYANDYTPLKDSVLADFTQPVVSGYATIDLDPADWLDAVNTAGTAQAIWSAGAVFFEALSGPVNVYGYFVADADSNFCLWADRFPGAPLVLNVGQPVPVFPVMRLQSLFQP